MMMMNSRNEEVIMSLKCVLFSVLISPKIKFIGRAGSEITAVSYV